MKDERSDGARVAKALCGCKLVAICADTLAARQAMNDYGHLIEACAPDNYCAHWWWFRELKNKAIREQAWKTAGDADYLIVGAPVDAPIPVQVREWIRTALNRVRDRTVRVIGLFGHPDAGVGGEGLANVCLAALAREADVNYTVHWYQTLPAHEAGSLVHLGQRAAELTPVLRQILTRKPSWLPAPDSPVM